MKPFATALALIFYCASLISITYSSPQAAQPGIEGLSGECSNALTGFIRTVSVSCVSELQTLQRQITANPNPEQQFKLFFAGTSTLCGAKCFDVATQSGKIVESKCNRPNTPDENVMWFFKHALSGSSILCLKEGGQLCVNKIIDQARRTNALARVMPMVMPLITSVNAGALRAIPRSNPTQLFNIAAAYLNDVIDKLPKEVVCGTCQRNMATKAYIYFRTVYYPHFVVKLKQPDPTAAVNGMIRKATTKCAA
ncbi:hypothetical protein BKA69DRAFT_1121757 [Paraphysoderma sedebokerense]|nr:hypothetical protein BKA69DRAFT_1121757 [Paraphysoderma sedebokerense]